MKTISLRSYRPKYSGYGYGTMEFATHLARAGYNFRLEYPLEQKVKSGADVIIHSGFPHLFKPEVGVVNIARVMLESDSLPVLWAGILNQMDEVWVASRFNVKSFVKGGVDKKLMRVIPDMVSPLLTPKVFAHNSHAPFRFLSVFLDLSLRKGWDKLLDRFIKTYGGSKDVEWVIQCEAKSAKRLKAVLKKLASDGKEVGNIIVRGKRPSATGMRQLYHSADCYMLATRGEGFGRPYLEAAACGLPIIATGWSGHLDFLNRKNARLLNYSLKPLPVPAALDCYFLAGQKWAEPCGRDITRALKEMVARPKLEPVDVTPFQASVVMPLMLGRIESLMPKKRRNIAVLPAEIITYDKNWKGSSQTEKQFLKIVKQLGKNIAIAGSGRNAGWLAEFLQQHLVNVPFFIDRNSGRFMKKPVYAVAPFTSGKKVAEVDAILISTFPASFEEWQEMLKGDVPTLPLIFYKNLGGF